MDTPVHLMLNTYAVWRRTETVDDGGCPVADYSAVAGLEAVRARVQPGIDREAVVNDVERSRATHTMYSEPVTAEGMTVDLSASDRVILTGSASIAGEYDVVSVHDPDDVHVYLHVLLEKVV